MARGGRRVKELRSLWVLFIAVGMLAGVVMTSCGGTSGGSDGELCNQCGDDPDGPCMPSINIVPVVPDDPDDRIPQCTSVVDPASGTCTVELQCRRKVDSGQRRCYPVLPGGDVDYQFRCDGSRPGGTPRPPVVTLTPTPKPSSGTTQECGNGIREGTEECDLTDLDGQTCFTQGCDSAGGFLSCLACQFLYNNCSNGGLGCGP